MEALSLSYKFIQTLDSRKDAVIITDLTPRPKGPLIIYINYVFLDFLGYELEEVINQSPRMFQTDNNSKELLDLVYKRIMSGDKFTVDLENKKKNGEIFRNRITIEPFGINNEYRIGYSILPENIVDDARIEEMINSLKKTVQWTLNIPEGVYILTSWKYPWKITIVERRSMGRLIGWDSTDLEGRPLVEFIDSSTVKDFCKDIQTAVDLNHDLDSYRFEVQFNFLTPQQVYKKIRAIVHHYRTENSFIWMFLPGKVVVDSEILTTLSVGDIDKLLSESIFLKRQEQRDQLQDITVQAQKETVESLDFKITTLKEVNAKLMEKLNALDDKMNDIYPVLIENNGIIPQYRRKKIAKRKQMASLRSNICQLTVSGLGKLSIGLLILLFIDIVNLLFPEHEQILVLIKNELIKFLKG